MNEYEYEYELIQKFNRISKNILFSHLFLLIPINIIINYFIF